MTPERVRDLVARYKTLAVAVFGDFCLDRYLEIDPAREEVSIETGLPAHQVVRVRSRPGAAGTVMNNVVALGVGRRYAVGIRGDDGEGYELAAALAAQKVDTEHLVVARERRTFTYTKPLVIEAGKLPRELSRLDIKNWTPTPPELEDRVVAHLHAVLPKVQAVIVMDQVGEPDRGTITARMRQAIADAAEKFDKTVFLADSRRYIGEFAGVVLKLNRSELRAVFAGDDRDDRRLALALAARTGRPVFVTLGAEGLWAVAEGRIDEVPGIRVAGPIDVVGAGDAVSANIAAALTAGAGPMEAAFLGNLAGSIVVQKIGTTGTASAEELIRKAKEAASAGTTP
jgi:rfaE bifunctional protein kinase chain/domain